MIKYDMVSYLWRNNKWYQYDKFCPKCDCLVTMYWWKNNIIHLYCPFCKHNWKHKGLNKKVE